MRAISSSAGRMAVESLALIAASVAVGSAQTIMNPKRETSREKASKGGNDKEERESR